MCHLSLRRTLLTQPPQVLLLVLLLLKGQFRNILSTHVRMVHELVQLDGRLGMEVTLLGRLSEVDRGDGLHLGVDAWVDGSVGLGVAGFVRGVAKVLVEFLALWCAVLHEEV